MLDARVNRLEAAVERLAEVQMRTQEALEALTRRVDRVAGVVGVMRGDLLELRYREHAAAYFQHLIRRIRLIPRDELEVLADDAEQQGRLTSEEHADLVRADLVLRGRLRDRPTAEAYLVAEVSSVVDSRGVERSARRAALLERAANLPVLAAVCGATISAEADALAQRVGVRPVIAADEADR